MKRKILIYLWIIFFVIINKNVLSQDKIFNYNNWGGKSASTKKTLVIKDDFVKNYNLSIRNGQSGNYVSYRMKLNDIDTDKKGILKIKIFLSYTEAQLELLDHLKSISSPVIPTKLDNYKYLDVAFGQELNGYFELAFTKNNIFVFIQATTEKAFLIAKEIADNIEAAPLWKEDDQIPNLVYKENILNIKPDAK